MPSVMFAFIPAVLIIYAFEVGAQNNSSVPSGNGTYRVKNSYEGSSFFTGWNWITGYDNLTHGSVNYLSQSNASASGLAVMTSDGKAKIAVDNTSTVAAGGLRNSVRIESTATVVQGDIVIFDASHVPYGCSVWPAFWMYGQNWPSNGEIDILEGVNAVTLNHMTLHTTAGFTHDDAASQTGTTVSTDCNTAINGNQGCSVADTNPASYGAAFAAAGGGVWAVQWAPNGINAWFFSRPSVPSDIKSGSPNPAGWGVPKASWLNTTSSLSKYFGPQNLVFDITLCGDWAGNSTAFSETCSGQCTDLIANPRNYDNAYFLVNSVKVYNQA